MSGIACNPSSVDPEPATGQFSFILFRNTTPIWSQTGLFAGNTYAYGFKDLQPASLVSLHPSFASNPVHGLLKTGGGDPNAPFEVQLFARDPEEVATTLSNFTDELTFINNLATPLFASKNINGGNVTLPDEISIVHPVDDHLDPINLPMFRENDESFGGVQGGSIKAVRFVQNGLCARTVRFDSNIFPLVQGILASQLAGTCDLVTTLRLDWLTAASSLRHKDVFVTEGVGDPLDARGGFMVNGGGFLQLNPFGTCTFKFNGFYEATLQDAIANIHLSQPAVIVGDSGGTCTPNGIPLPTPPFFLEFPGALGLINYELATDVPNTVNAILKQRQRFSLPEVSGFTNGWACTPQPPPAPGTVAPNDGCTDARTQFRDNINFGAKLLNIAQADANLLISAAEAKNPNGSFRNWTCEAAPNQKIPEGQCFYTVRAKRLTVNPDDMRIVWFDNFKDYSNSALSLYVFINGIGGGPLSPLTKKGVSQLCSVQTQAAELNAPYGNDHFWRRSFSVFRADPFTCPNQ